MANKRASNPHIRWFDEIGIEDVPLVGGKNASLGEMYRELTPKGVKVPNGFAVTADAYRYFLRESGVDRRLREVLQGLDTRDIENLRQRGRRARDLILEADVAPRPPASDGNRLRAALGGELPAARRRRAQQRHGRRPARRQLRRASRRPT